MQEPVRSIESLIVSSIRKELDSAGQEQLKAWLAVGDNQATFDRITDQANVRKGLVIMHETAQRKHLLKAKLDRAIDKKPFSLKIKLLRIKKWPRYAAVVLIIGGGIAAAYLAINRKKKDVLADTYNLMNWLQNRQLPVVFNNTVSTPYGRRTRLVLTDSSVVYLNSLSTIRYAVIPTTWKRTVELTGEASFEVESRNRQPFVVSVSDSTGKRRASFEVLGTTFNLNAYYDEDEIRATLVKGVIRISVAGNDVLLQAGQQAVIGPAGVISIHPVDASDVLAWQQGKLRYHNANIRSVMRMIARQYGIKAVFDGVANEDYNGVISNRLTLKQALDLLQSTTEYNFTIEGDLVKVRSKRLQR